MKAKFLFLIICLTLFLFFIFPFNLKTGKFIFHISNQFRTALIFSLISLFLILTTIRIVKIEEEKYLPPGVHFEISEDIEKFPYKSYIEKGIEKIKKFFKKDLSINKIYEKHVKESEEYFNYESFSKVGYGPNAITIRLTAKGFAPELYKNFTYIPFGITMGNKIVISIKHILEKAKHYDLSEIILKTAKHETWHTAGGKDDPYSKGIANPSLQYEIKRSEKEIMKEKLLEKAL
jgi:hypothetical protein